MDHCGCPRPTALSAHLRGPEPRPGHLAKAVDTHLTCFPSLRDHGPSFSGVQYFEHHVFCLFFFLIVLDGRINPVPTAPSCPALDACLYSVSQFTECFQIHHSCRSKQQPLPWSAQFPPSYCCKHFTARGKGDLPWSSELGQDLLFPAVGVSSFPVNRPGWGEGMGRGMNGQERLREDVGLDLWPDWLTLGMKKEQGLILGGQASQTGV